MDKNRYTIGVCITKIDDNSRADYMHRLHRLAERDGYRLIVFNTLIDFYSVSPSDKGAKSVFDIINFDIIDALVIHTNSFCNQSVVDEIISNARNHGKPVILLGRTVEGCFSIVGDYEDSFKKIIRHVIKDHGAADTHFIAGVEGPDIFSAQRIRCYKEVLEECGLPFSDDMVSYGHYWVDPTRKVVNKLLENGKKPPRAIFCANDYMAFAVCNELKNHGYRVPDDVIVTGYDGVPAAEHFEPRITTCAEDLSVLAEKTLEAVKLSLEDKEPCVLHNHFTSVITESCGCNKVTGENFRSVSTELYYVIDNIKIHEEYISTCINQMLGIKDLNDLYTCLSYCAPEGSYICLNSNFVSAVISGNDSLRSKVSEDLIVIHSKFPKKGNISRMKLSDMILADDSNNNDPRSYILTSIYVGNDVYGYYVFRTDDFINTSYKIKRVINAINVAFTIASGYFKQLSMRLSIKRSSVINTLTDLPNLKGTATWFDEFSTPENQNKCLSISVFALPKYTYIMENYGIDAAEEAVVLVANALKLANTGERFIGHISEDEFVVINYYDDHKTIGDVVDSATSAFYAAIEDYNANSGKEYYIEVNCGCTVVNPGWNASIESLIKFANSEMYMNRLKYGMGDIAKPETDLKAYYKKFELLIEKNLFHYHFQPIVNAKNGEIVAYEALMRTDDAINMTPHEILDTAKQYNRLYDIEKATMFNVMEYYANNREQFGNKKVFINSIPGYFLKGDDMNNIYGKYRDLMENFIFELTEQDTVADDELERLKQLTGNFTHTPIAIDDYGTGHSNIMNLLRYSPQIIKIDHFLISDIYKNQNKQHFVRSIIEFAKLNGILVLAEGVETSNELHTLIDLGVDFIQGFYTGRPAPVPASYIDEEIRQEIIDANPLY